MDRIRDAPIPLFLFLSTSTYIWVLADTEYRYGYLIIPLQFKEPVNPLSKREFIHFAILKNAFWAVSSRKEGGMLSLWLRTTAT